MELFENLSEFIQSIVVVIKILADIDTVTAIITLLLVLGMIGIIYGIIYEIQKLCTAR